MEGAILLSKKLNNTIVISGAVDYVVTKDRVTKIHNGSKLMSKVTGMGCTATAIVGACIAVEKDSIILDFFSGSATTANAVMQLNAEDGGNRKFIMVQLPEETNEKSEAYKAGYKNICEIGKERIRRAGAKIHEDRPDTVFDDGFKVYKIN